MLIPGRLFSSKGVRLVTGGTENHLLIVDLTQFGLTGRQAETALREASITLNRNAIPFDLQGAWYTSGIRIGTPALTTLGMGKEEMAEIAEIILDVVAHTKPSEVKATGSPSKAKSTTDAKILDKSKQRVHALLSQFPLYPEIEI